jgi:hypothetical protein
MPSLDGADHPLVSALHEAFAALVEDESVDIVPSEDDKDQEAFEVQADDWTLFAAGWPVTTAWIALDEDVISPEAFRTALESALGQRELQALETLDSSLSGDLADALTNSDDELSIALAALLRADVADD